MGLRNLLLGLLVLIAAAITVILLPGDNQPEPVVEQQDPVEVTTPRTGTSPVASEPAAAEAATREQMVVPEAGPIEFTSDIQPPSEDADALLVRCTDRDSGERLAGATVYYLDQSAMSEETMWVALTSSASIAEVLTRFSKRYRADENGEVKVPYSGDLALAGRHEGRFHVETLYQSKPGDVVELKLYQQPKLPVLVVDEHGAPVTGASVVLRVVWDEWRMDMLRLDTDEKGLATFEDFDIFGQNWEEQQMYVGIGETLTKPVEAAISEDNIADGAEPVRLVMPAVGAIDVAVFDREGEPCADEVIVRLSPYYGDDEELHGIGGDGRTAYAATSDGIARFHYVGLGQEVVAGAFMNGIVQPSDAEGRGPTAAGQTVRIEVHEDVSFPILIGQVTYEGEPLAGEVVELMVRVVSDEYNWDEKRNIELDESGAFRTQIAELEADSGEGRLILIRKTVDGKPLYARTDLPASFVRGEIDLGVLALQPEPVLLSGRVVDGQGEPIAAAQLDLQRRFDWGLEAGDFYWNSLDVDAKTQADGSFELTGVVEPGGGAIRLNVQHETHVPTSAEVSIGQSDVVVRMAAAGKLTGNVIVDEGFPSDVLTIMIEYPSGLSAEMEESLDSYVGVDAETKEFEFVTLPLGIARVIVTTDNELELVVIEGVVVAVDGSPDSRLRDIDLRGLVFAHKLRILDLKGEALESAVAIESNVDDSWHWGWQGEITIICQSAVADLMVFSEGYRRTAANGVSGEAEVRMADGIELVIRWSGPMPKLEGGSWGIQIDPVEDDTYSWLESDAQPFDDHGEARATVSTPGEYIITATARIDEGWSSMEFPTDATVQVQVRDSGNPVYQISVSDEVADQARKMIEAQTAGEINVVIDELDEIEF